MPTILTNSICYIRRSIIATSCNTKHRRLHVKNFFRRILPIDTSTSMMMSSQQQGIESQTLRFIDIGANLLDERYIHGVYRGTYRHVPDIAAVIERAIQNNVKMIIITAGTIEESRLAIQQTRLWNQQYNNGDDTSSLSNNIRFACTVGVHPTRCSQVFCQPSTVNNTDTTTTTTVEEDVNIDENDDDVEYANTKINELYDLCIDGMSDDTVIAYGECGLDYDRLEFCSIEIQKQYLYRQLIEIALPLNLPLFLHNRNVQNDLYTILLEIQEKYSKEKNSIEPTEGVSSVSSITKTIQDHWNGSYRGVVHSFDDTYELAIKFITDLQLFIGINGCSLRTEQNMETVQQLPIDRILLETDCPYCDVRSTHIGYKYIQTHFTASSQSEKKFIMGQMVKSRQEPCHIRQIAEIIAGIKNMDLHSVTSICYNNTLQVFFSDKKNH